MAPPTTIRQPPSNPPISSIRPSEISRKQIETLRSNLKYHEDQLQYNKHQIDEREMEKTIRMLTQEIQRFEGVHQMQLANEEKNYPKREKSNDGMSQAGSQACLANFWPRAQRACSSWRARSASTRSS